MYCYCITDITNLNLEDNLVKMDATFKSEDGGEIEGEIHIGLTEYNDIILRVYPWGCSPYQHEFKPLSYNLKSISSGSVDKENGSYNVRIDEVEIQVSDERIDLVNDNGSVEVILDKTTDLKGNRCANGTGFKTEKFKNNPQSVEEVNLNVRMNSEERIYGGGERFKRINHRGSEVKIQVTQAAGSKSDKTYKSVPRFISDRGYGYSVNTYNTVVGSFGTKSSEVMEMSSDDSSIEVLFTIGDDVKDCLSRLYRYETENKNPPLWSYGFWSSRNTYQSWDEVMDVAEEYREREVPCDVIHLDPGWLGSFQDYDFTWADSFDEAEEHIRKLHDLGFKISIWLYPYVPISSPMYKETSKSYFVDDLNNNNFIFDDKNKLAIVDFTNPDAFEWWSNKLSKVISDGVDIIKADFGEYISEDTVFYNNRTGSEMQNAYPDIYQDACVSAFEKVDKKPLLWSRSGWLSQNKHSVHWNGDAESDWEGYRATIRSGLNAAMSSYNFWSSDVGGYKKNPSDRLYGEWMKFSSFGSSHIRAHGKSPREPWEYPSSYSSSKKVLQERYKLIPYLYSYGQVAEETGIPIMRPECINIEDRSYSKENTQFFVGDHLLVAPYLTPERSRNVYLPADSDWVSYWDEDQYVGGTEISADHENSMIPVFVRKGALIPVFDDNIQHVKSEDSVSVKRYGVPDSRVETPYYNGDELLNLVSNPNGGVDNKGEDVIFL